MVIYDITIPIFPGMPVYENDPQVRIIEDKSIRSGDLYNLSIITFGSHTGTHIDAPRHFLEDGPSLEQLPPDKFYGKAKVLEIKDKGFVTPDDLKKHDIMHNDIILLKTSNSSRPPVNAFRKDFAWISPAACEYLAACGIKTLGFDYLSIEKYGSTVPDAHYILLRNNIVIIEGLVLNDIPEGEYIISALPLNIKGGNGSPARAVLIKEEP